MEIEIARVGYEINQAEVYERHDVQKKHDGLQNVLTVGPGVFRRGRYSFAIIPEWMNGCATISSPKYSGAANAKSVIEDGWIEPV